MRKYLKNTLAVLFLFMLLVGGIGAYALIHIQSNAKLINYVGIVRGGTQRLVKLELNQNPNNTMLSYLDGIVKELNTGNGTYGLPLPDDTSYQTNLKELTTLWTTLKEDIYAYRKQPTSNETLMKHSEDYFNKANETVFAAEEYTSSQLKRILFLWVILLLIMLILWFSIFYSTFKKIFRLQSKNIELSDQAKRDTLTGVYLFPYFKEVAQTLLDSRTTEKYALVYTDFADFKYINDVYGYSYGDKILAHYGNLLRDNLKDGEVCGRVSADNFVLLLTYEDSSELIKRQQFVDQAVMDFMEGSPHHQILLTCCGICCLEDIEETLHIDGYLDRANIARSTVKSGENRNYMIYNNEIRKHLMENKNIESCMSKAFELEEFFVEYQPKVDVKTGVIKSAEALVRWRLDGTIIPPDRFIPVFEKKLVINRLDQYVLKCVCKMLRQQINEGKNVLPIAVNVSRLQFYDENFIESYVRIRDEYQIPPTLIEIEFTESIVFENSQLMKSIVDDLHKQKFHCAIDDFGKGYSSLSLLKDLQVDYLKIDSYFFQQGKHHEREDALIQGIIDMAHKLQMKTIAEGIEHQDQVELLKSFGCDFIQGFVFYRPLSQKDFLQLLQTL